MQFCTQRAFSAHDSDSPRVSWSRKNSVSCKALPFNTTFTNGKSPSFNPFKALLPRISIFQPCKYRGMAGADNSQSRGGSKEPRRNLRLRLACARCQRRKIRVSEPGRCFFGKATDRNKCDGNVPTCNNCKKASVECVDGESVRLGDLPRAYVTHLIMHQG